MRAPRRRQSCGCCRFSSQPHPGKEGPGPTPLRPGPSQLNLRGARSDAINSPHFRADSSASAASRAATEMQRVTRRPERPAGRAGRSPHFAQTPARAQRAAQQPKCNTSRGGRSGPQGAQAARRISRRLQRERSEPRSKRHAKGYAAVRPLRAAFCRRRISRCRSIGVSPPHTPSDGRTSSANSRHCSRTGQVAQIAFASSACASEAGKNTVVSASRQAASSNQSVEVGANVLRGTTASATHLPKPPFPPRAPEILRENQLRVGRA